MSHRRSRVLAVVSVAAVAVVTATSLTPPVASATAPDEFAGWSDTPWLERTVNPSPADRYEPAGGCYAVRVADGPYLARGTTGELTALAVGPDEAEGIRFQATDLGSYLLYASDETFLSGVDGAPMPGERAEALIVAGDHTATFSPVDLEGRPAQVATTPARLSSALGQIDTASWLADWRLDEIGRASDGDVAFGLTLPGPGDEDTLPHASAAGTGDEPADADVVLFDQVLVADADTGALTRADAATTAASPLTLELLADDRCATFPEMALDVEGEPMQAADLDGPVRGWVDAHIHLMATEFLGGRAHCGDPWHRWGVEHAMVDCEDHGPGGVGGLLETFLSGRPEHDTTGWPTFADWPRHDSLTHEGTYHRWVERAWRGGLRSMTVLLVENSVLCDVYPLKQNSCDEMDSVRLQARRVRDLQDYVDAQYGGPGNGWFRVVTSADEARRVINSGRMAVVLGIEVSEVFGCRVKLGRSECTTTEIDQQLDEMYDLGVRQMELVNKFDNALSGVAGDGGALGPVVNLGNFYATGSFWRMEDCDRHEHAPATEGGHDHDGHDHDGDADNHQMTNVPQPMYDGAGELDGHLTGDDGSHEHDEGEPGHNHDALAQGVLQVAGTRGAAPVYVGEEHCNAAGLTHLGRHVLRRMAEKGMIFDPDHMSARAREEAIAHVRHLDSIGTDLAMISSHSWAGHDTERAIYELGGYITPYAGGANGFVDKWQRLRGYALETGLIGSDDDVVGFGYGSDINGFGSQGGPRFAGGYDASDPSFDGVVYGLGGFSGLDGLTTVRQHVAGFAGDPARSKVYDVNTVGVAHYGLYPDWVADITTIAERRAPGGGAALAADLAAGAETFLQLWERAEG